MQILIDTNVWIYAAKNKIDLIELIKKKFGLVGIYTPNVVIKELEKLQLSARKGADKAAAKLALQIIRQRRLPQPKLSEYGDKAIIQWAKAEGAAVLTNDLELRLRLKQAGVKVYCLRQGKLVQG